MTRRAPNQLWRAEQSAAADAYTMKTRGVPSAILMERAALSVANVICERYAKAKQVLVLCGPGNNGGDGLAIARMLQHRGWAAQAWVVTERRGESVQAQAKLAETYKVPVHSGVPQAAAESGTVIVDALLGTGATGDPRGEVAGALAWAAQQPGGARIAVDIPTGLDANTGTAAELAFVADATVSFERSKPGLHTAEGPRVAGQVYVAEIGLLFKPQELGVPADKDAAPIELCLIDPQRVQARLQSLAGARHKGERGRVTVAGGSPGTAGAALLSASAALRTGAGLVHVASAAPELAQHLLQHQPELMSLELQESAEALPKSVRVVGPGWTQATSSDLAGELWAHDAEAAVWDASGLQVIAGKPAPGAGPRVITPHPKEAAELLGRLANTEVEWTTAKVQGDRVSAACALAQLTGAVVVLKGVGTVVATATAAHICVAGAASLATAGSGDVLAGVIGGLLAQGFDALEAATCGVHLHAAAGEQLGEGPGAVAGDVCEAVGALLRELESDAVATAGRWPVFLAG